MFYKPDYEENSIVNLMSSISNSFGVNSEYRELKSLPAKSLEGYRNVIHIVIDGLGYNYLLKKRKNYLKDHTVGKITSVFPSTTSACITSFATGLAPKEHGITGWFVRIKTERHNIPATILLFNDRRDEISLEQKGIMPEDVFTDFRLSKQIGNVKVLLPESLMNSVYTNYFLEGSEKGGYKGLENFFSNLTEAVRSVRGDRNYVYGYLPDLDAVLHKTGSRSEDPTKLFYSICKHAKKFTDSIRGTNSIVIITADHGLIDGSEDKKININEFPDISKMLEFPLCGDPRAAYCYVKDEYRKDFTGFVTEKIGYAVEIFTKEKMLKEGYFGLYKPHPDLDLRIGDFILICKENYVIKDFLQNEAVGFHAADHGGLSADEMFIPLIVIET